MDSAASAWGKHSTTDLNPIFGRQSVLLGHKIRTLNVVDLSLQGLVDTYFSCSPLWHVDRDDAYIPYILYLPWTKRGGKWGEEIVRRLNIVKEASCICPVLIVIKVFPTKFWFIHILWVVISFDRRVINLW